MVELLARQSVIIKCNMEKGSLLGNYEFYYAAGLFCKLAGYGAADVPDGALPDAPQDMPFGSLSDDTPDIPSMSLKEFLADKLDAYGAADGREAYLVRILKEYDPGSAYDGQMKKLFLWGAGEEYPWSVNGGA